MPIIFDPNNPAKQQPWATFITSRNPQFKLHASRGPAISACSKHTRYGNTEFVLFKLNNGRWDDVVRWEHPLPDKLCHICGNPPTSNWSYGFKARWINKKQDIPDFVYLCEDHAKCQ